ncbi:uncharacterized protein LOC106649069 [Trichogramma pretiosum]|uniref:uncharacterized protein LOC106649069 n=1 Tax=Trichogramma pretiosum TaxID=7493 RepID=UPI0006C96401|nr:uncharacterized protein LOC106649069 [Trichogramma pretiosum]
MFAGSRSSVRLCLVIFCCLVASALAIEESSSNEAKLTSFMDDLNRRDSIEIVPSIVSLDKITEVNETSEKNIEEDPLMRRIDAFFDSRRLSIRFPSDGSSSDLFGRALGRKSYSFEMRGLISGASEPRTKLKRIIVPILLALKLKAAIVLPIMLTLIGLIGIKGLGAGVLALLLSGAVALKALLTPSHIPTSYHPARITYAAKPYVDDHYDIYDHHHDHHGAGGWHRSQEDLLSQPQIHAWTPELVGLHQEQQQHQQQYLHGYPELPV